ncbi:hypothetical protein BDL97_01G123300 [Sphagnum fallax]|nr:hypothetical protein BDL97_01G123300 [Sphagnum fallax]
MHISTPRSNVGISSILKHEYRMQGATMVWQPQ